MSFAEYEQYDGLGLAELIQRKDVTPLELVEAAIARIEASNGALNAVIHTMYNQARHTAQQDVPAGPLRGVPMLLKDLLSLYAGAPMTTGSRYRGIFGLKPTRGRTPTGPDYGELWEGMAVEHVLTRTVRDSAVMLDVLAGPDGRYADEVTLFRLAGQIEQAQPWSGRRPSPGTYSDDTLRT